MRHRAKDLPVSGHREAGYPFLRPPALRSHADCASDDQASCLEKVNQMYICYVHIHIYCIRITYHIESFHEQVFPCASKNQDSMTYSVPCCRRFREHLEDDFVADIPSRRSFCCLVKMESSIESGALQDTRQNEFLWEQLT